MEFATLIIGIIIGVGMTSYAVVTKYDLVVKQPKTTSTDEEDLDVMDNEYEYYVMLPDATEDIVVRVEEPLQLHHWITIDKTRYFVNTVEHKDNGHTIFHLI